MKFLSIFNALKKPNRQPVRAACSEDAAENDEDDVLASSSFREQLVKSFRAQFGHEPVAKELDEWFHGGCLPPRSEEEAEQSPEATASAESPNDTFIDEVISCARHALVMGYRAEHSSSPSPTELACWVDKFWTDTGRVEAMIELHNNYAASFSRKIPDFMERLRTAVTAQV